MAGHALDPGSPERLPARVVLRGLVAVAGRLAAVGFYALEDGAQARAGPLPSTAETTTRPALPVSSFPP